jgi:hypothetical protein
MTKTLIIQSNGGSHLIDLISEDHRREKTFLASFSQGNLQLLALFSTLEVIFRLGDYQLEVDLTEGDHERLKKALVFYSTGSEVINALRQGFDLPATT